VLDTRGGRDKKHAARRGAIYRAAASWIAMRMDFQRWRVNTRTDKGSRVIYEGTFLSSDDGTKNPPRRRGMSPALARKWRARDRHRSRTTSERFLATKVSRCDHDEITRNNIYESRFRACLNDTRSN